MMGNIDWSELSSSLDLLRMRNGGGWDERSGTVAACQAIERIVGPDALRASVDYYLAGHPGAELARSVLWLLHPPSAMERCHEVYLTSPNVEERQSAVELLRVVADDRVLGWVPSYLSDPDPLIQIWAIGIVDQLLYSGLAEFADCTQIIAETEKHSNEAVRERAANLASYREG